MKNRLIRLITVMLLCVLTTTVFANKNCPSQTLPAPVKEQWNRHTGFYLEASAGTNAFYALLPTGNQGSMLGYNVAAALGYFPINNVGIEAGFIYSSDLNAAYEKSLAGLITLSASAAAKLYVPYIAIRFHVPIGNRVNVIFKLGGMYPYGKVKVFGSAAGIEESGRISGDHTMPFTGIGISYAITPNLALVVQYQGAIYVLASGGVLSGGLVYHL